MLSTSISATEALKLTFYTVAALLVVRQTYKALPSWAKPKLGNNKDNNDNPDANDDICNPLTILSKMQAMMQLCRDEVPDDLPWFQVHACFLALLHLQAELQLAHPTCKRRQYQQGGGAKPYRNVSELQELVHYCQLAKWAYAKQYLELHGNLKAAGYALIRHDIATEPGRVGHFVAVQHGEKLAVIAIKGTSTLSDALTDVLGQAREHVLENALTTTTGGNKDTNPITRVRIHEGMYAAAQLLLDDTLHLVQHFFVPRGYRVVVTGHSLGAGVACLLGLFLRTAVGPDLLNLRVWAFATPPCLDLDACRAMQDFCTTVVNNTDCIPRSSVQNLVHLNRLFTAIHGKLQAQGRAPTNWKSTRAFLRDLTKIDAETLLTPDELLQVQADAVDQAPPQPHALFVPGRTLVLWESAGKFDCVQGDGSLLALRHFDVATTMISDHPCLKYKENLGRLLQQWKDEEQSQK